MVTVAKAVKIAFENQLAIMHDEIAVNAVLRHGCTERQRFALPVIAKIFDIARCTGRQILDWATARHHQRGQGGEVAQVPAYVFRVAPSVKMGGARHHSGCFAHLFLLKHPVMPAQCRTVPDR